MMDTVCLNSIPVPRAETRDEIGMKRAGWRACGSCAFGLLSL